jgi:predicted transposase/invertase (TIGR01784 family)
MKRDDTLWKAILEDVFEDFLTFFYPDSGKLFDLEKGFEYLDKELEQLFPPEQDIYSLRFVDKLVKVFTKEGSEQWILVHVEVQGYPDRDFAQRMFTYYYRILDKYQKPITAFAILTDGNTNYSPDRYERSFLGTTVLYKFNSYKVLNQETEMLLNNDNPFALVILVVQAAIRSKKLNDNQIFALKMDLTKRLLTKKISKSKIRKLLNFLKYYIRFENKETDVKFERELDLITENRKTMGIEEFLLDRAEKTGIKKGQFQSSIDFTKALLSNTNFTAEKIASLVGVSIDFVNEIKAEIES